MYTCRYNDQQLVNLTGVSKEINKTWLIETKVWRNQTAIIVQQIIPSQYDKTRTYDVFCPKR